MRSIGLHLRLMTTMPDLARKAYALKLPIFQSFCVFQQTGKMIQPTVQEIDEFVKLRTDWFDTLYLHGSYWINLARNQYNAFRIAARELEFAENHAFNYMIIHPGSGLQNAKKTEAIQILANNLNKLLKKKTTVNLILENTAHAKNTLGSDLHDFKLLLEYIDKPEQLFYCIDTAHAYVYGYQITTHRGIEQFIKIIESMIGSDQIILLHVNDTNQKLGSRIDQHCEPGKGLIGQEWLTTLLNQPIFKDKSIIIEPPVMVDAQLKNIVNDIHTWL